MIQSRIIDAVLTYATGTSQPEDRSCILGYVVDIPLPQDQVLPNLTRPETRIGQSWLITVAGTDRTECLITCAAQTLFPKLSPY